MTKAAPGTMLIAAFLVIVTPTAAATTAAATSKCPDPVIDPRGYVVCLIDVNPVALTVSASVGVGDFAVVDEYWCAVSDASATIDHHGGVFAYSWEVGSKVTLAGGQVVFGPEKNDDYDTRAVATESSRVGLIFIPDGAVFEAWAHVENLEVAIDAASSSNTWTCNIQEALTEVLDSVEIGAPTELLDSATDE